MKAIVLAAGVGNRMKPLTDKLPKTMLVVSGKTIIGRIIEGLLENGVENIVVVTGYCADMLTSYLEKEYPQATFTFVHNSRFDETNNIFSLYLAVNTIEIDDDIILIESDLICEPRIFERIVSTHFANATIVDKFKSGMDGTVVTISDKVITGIIPPHLQGSDFDFSDKFKTLNIYRFSKEFCTTAFRDLLTYYAKVIDDKCYYELILGILIYMQRERIHAEIIDDEVWSEVDDPNDLSEAEYSFNRARRIEILDDTFGGYWNYPIIDFCFLRNMYFPTTSILSELKNSLINLVHNYGSRQAILDRKLSYTLLCDHERIHVLNGASQFFPILKNLLVQHRVLIPSPTFGEYGRLFPGADTYYDTVGIDRGEMERKAAHCSAVVFVNPNSPTGSFVDSQWIFDFARRRPDRMIIVDESFIDFSGAISIIELLERTPLDNIIVLKSLSKGLGVPGIRLGFSYSCKRDINDTIADALPIWNINSIAEFFLEIIIKHRLPLAESFRKTIEDREEFSKALSRLPFICAVYPSSANFLLVRFTRKRRALASLRQDLLSRYDIYVKDVSDRFNDGSYYLRLAVRLPHENSLLVKILSELVGDE